MLRESRHGTAEFVAVHDNTHTSEESGEDTASAKNPTARLLQDIDDGTAKAAADLLRNGTNGMGMVPLVAPPLLPPNKKLGGGGSTTAPTGVVGKACVWMLFGTLVVFLIIFAGVSQSTALQKLFPPLADLMKLYAWPRSTKKTNHANFLAQRDDTADDSPLDEEAEPRGVPEVGVWKESGVQTENRCAGCKDSSDDDGDDSADDEAAGNPDQLAPRGTALPEVAAAGAATGGQGSFLDVGKKVQVGSPEVGQAAIKFLENFAQQLLANEQLRAKAANVGGILIDRAIDALFGDPNNGVEPDNLDNASAQEIANWIAANKQFVANPQKEEAAAGNDPALIEYKIEKERQKLGGDPPRKELHGEERVKKLETTQHEESKGFFESLGLTGGMAGGMGGVGGLAVAGATLMAQQQSANAVARQQTQCCGR